MTNRRKPSNRIGRRPSTTRGDISDIAIALFAERGFNDTSVDDIAEAAGIARRTFFRYFASKNAVPWGDFDAQLTALHDLFDTFPADVPLAEAIGDALLQFNTFPTREAAVHRQRMRLILQNPALQGYSMVMYEGWRRVIAQFVARRTGTSADHHVPRTIGWIVLGVAISAYEQWLADDNAELSELLARGTAMLYSGIDSLGIVSP